MNLDLAWFLPICSWRLIWLLLRFCEEWYKSSDWLKWKLCNFHWPNKSKGCTWALSSVLRVFSFWHRLRVAKSVNKSVPVFFVTDDILSVCWLWKCRLSDACFLVFSLLFNTWLTNRLSKDIERSSTQMCLKL